MTDITDVREVYIGTADDTETCEVTLTVREPIMTMSPLAAARLGHELIDAANRAVANANEIYEEHRAAVRARFIAANPGVEPVESPL